MISPLQDVHTAPDELELLLDELLLEELLLEEPDEPVDELLELEVSPAPPQPYRLSAASSTANIPEFGNHLGVFIESSIVFIFNRMMIEAVHFENASTAQDERNENLVTVLLRVVPLFLRHRAVGCETIQ